MEESTLLTLDRAEMEELIALWKKSSIQREGKKIQELISFQVPKLARKYNLDISPDTTFPQLVRTYDRKNVKDIVSERGKDALLYFIENNNKLGIDYVLALHSDIEDPVVWNYKPCVEAAIRKKDNCLVYRLITVASQNYITQLQGNNMQYFQALSDVYFHVLIYLEENSDKDFANNPELIRSLSFIHDPEEVAQDGYKLALKLDNRELIEDFETFIL